MKSPCARGREEVLYGWASDSDGHRLPDGVAYSVGPGTGILDVVLQVSQPRLIDPSPASPLPLPPRLVLVSHSMMLMVAAMQQVRYTAGRPAEDRSGFSLTVGAQPLPLAAGMLTFASLFTLPPKQPAYKVRRLQLCSCVCLARMPTAPSGLKAVGRGSGEAGAAIKSAFAVLLYVSLPAAAGSGTGCLAAETCSAVPRRFCDVTLQSR